MLSQYTRLVKEDCVMSGVEIAYHLNKVKIHQPHFTRMALPSLLKMQPGSLRWSRTLERNTDATEAACFLEKVARLCREESFCHVGKAQNSGAMYFWDEYDRLISGAEFEGDLTRMAALLEDEGPFANVFKRLLNTLAKNPYAPAVAPAFTAIYYEMLNYSLNEGRAGPMSARFRYKTLLREFADTDFGVSPVCKCCYRRVCTIEILEALPAYIWDIEESDNASSGSFMSVGAPSYNDGALTGAWFDGWARREMLQEGLNDFYLDFLESVDLQLTDDLRHDLEAFCALVDLSGLERSSDLSTFLGTMRARVASLTPDELKYWYTLLTSLVWVTLTPASFDRADSSKEYVIAGELLLSIWKACEKASLMSDEITSLKSLVASTLIREVNKMSPLLALWTAAILAKSLRGQNHFEGLEVGVVYVVRCILSLAIGAFDDVVHVKNSLQEVLQSFSEMLNFRVSFANKRFDNDAPSYDTPSAIGSDMVEYF